MVCYAGRKNPISFTRTFVEDNCYVESRAAVNGPQHGPERLVQSAYTAQVLQHGTDESCSQIQPTLNLLCPYAKLH